MGATVGWLPIDRPTVRHDRELAAIKEPHYILVRHVGIFCVLKAGHVLRFIHYLTEGRYSGVVVRHDCIDSLSVFIIKAQLRCRPLFI